MTSPGFAGLRVAAFESRMAAEMTRLIERYGGRPMVAPAMREVFLQDNPEALRFGELLLAGQVDIVILLTGVGTKTLAEILQTHYPEISIPSLLNQTLLVARGPKPVAALRTLGLTPGLTVPEPNTWYDILATLDLYRPVKGMRVAVQEYGAPNSEFLDALTERGAQVISVPIYRWALPENIEPLNRVLDLILTGQVEVMLVTNAAQIDHVMQLLKQDQKVEQFRQACTRMVIASIGPTASERLRSFDLPVDVEPSHPKMGILVKETSEQAPLLLQKKRAS